MKKVNYLKVKLEGDKGYEVKKAGQGIWRMWEQELQFLRAVRGIAICMCWEIASRHMVVERKAGGGINKCKSSEARTF